jgi:hypothetical protein
MPDQTLTERIALTRAEQQARITAAREDRRYRRAFAAVAMLRRNRWHVDVWDAHDGIHVSNGRPASGPHLCVTFTAPGDSRSTGSVAADGSLSGEPLDD